ncbi:hypothetical protein TRFO_13159 [Tritrichomonas foetus]|uniref:Thioredoxin domain-containing protein n=1 Tax=Tritrichomonas foetus TaxID=1144522 RepID=A0A1J4KZ82_9EUKA|nr:hypothetical protein TRFO_13159 [Tritrichomonas foetus]|eukprot:OHT16561.1 hypothetical protein TRFO_13159 [Tritrichomonas foetus]
MNCNQKLWLLSNFYNWSEISSLKYNHISCIIKSSMLFFLTLLFLTQSKIEPITREKYVKEVTQGKNKNRVWVFLLYTPFCKKYKEALNALEQAQILTNGTVKYGIVNCQGESTLCQSVFKVAEYPTIIFKNKTIISTFQETINPKSIAKTALKFIPTTNVQIVDDFWIDDFRDQPTAILFTQKTNIPGYWAALSRVFPPSKLRFGICNDDGLFQDYNVTTTPTIVFYNQTHEVVHESLRKIRFLKETAISFVQKRPNKSPLTVEFYLNSQFPEICYDYTVSCVLAYDNFVDPKLDDIRTNFKNDPFRFFVGDDHFPFSQAKRGQFVIYNAKKSSIIIVEDISLLSAALDRVIDGGAKWTQLKQLKYDYNLEL